MINVGGIPKRQVLFQAVFFLAASQLRFSGSAAKTYLAVYTDACRRIVVSRSHIWRHLRWYLCKYRANEKTDLLIFLAIKARASSKKKKLHQVSLLPNSYL